MLFFSYGCPISVNSRGDKKKLMPPVADISLPIFNWLVFLFLVFLLKVLYIFWTLVLYQIYDFQRLSPILSATFPLRYGFNFDEIQFVYFSDFFKISLNLAYFNLLN